MINLIIGEYYRLIGINDIDKGSIAEGCIIKILDMCTTFPKKYTYRVEKGYIDISFLSNHFTENSRMHAYCVPYPHKFMLPDLKIGDYIISIAKDSKALEVTEDYYQWLNRNGGTYDMRYATQDEAAEAKKGGSKEKELKADDYVVCLRKFTEIPEGAICRIASVYDDTLKVVGIYNKSFHKSHFRLAINLEINAYRNGFSFLNVYKDYVSRSAMERFPSPSSFTCLNGITYHHIEYHNPLWIHGKLYLTVNTGPVYHDGKWATPIVKDISGSIKNSRLPRGSDLEVGLAVSDPVSYIAEYRSPISNIHTSDFILEDVVSHLLESSEKKGRPFDEHEFLSRPMNQRMDLPMKKTRKQSIHNSIKF